MMASMAVSVSMGVMIPLLAKLTTLMGEKYKRLKGLRKEVSFLKDELTTINAFLEKMDNVHELDSLAKNWRKHVIEMSYDIEDCIDNFIQHVAEADDNKVGILQKACQYVRTFNDHNRIANQIKQIKNHVIQESERRIRYKLDYCISNTTTVFIDPRLSALYKEASSLVGIDDQKKAIINWVMDHERQLKMASIVGSGGLGKTTLANVVYHEVRGQFNCKAFVSVSQKPDMMRVLNSAILQVGQPEFFNACEIQDLINILREYLQDKRYLIIVDDLWDVRTWNAMSCVFPQNDKHSRVIITTRNMEVARACGREYGCIHNMKPLSETNSRKLFFNRIFGTKDSCPSQLMEVSCEILKKCGGLPLAIITVASILANQPTKIKEQWEYIKNSLSVELAEDSTLEDMMHILDLSYKNLPRHLKACFLYLGIYPEDWEIRRNELVRQWVAGGFVGNSPGRDVWDIANSYFNELINRSMIQPAYDDLNVEVLSCKLHDMMRDLIVRRCNEDNFLRVLHDLQDVAQVQDKVRRLSLDLSFRNDGTMPITTSGHLSKVRSLAIFGGSQHIPSFLEFKFIRVLFLDFSKLVTRIDLTSITQLSQLRYLKAECSIWFTGFPKLSTILPSQICRVRYLETLELPWTSSCSIPKDIIYLPRLSHLVLPLGTRLPDGIGKLKSLRTLRGFSLSKSSFENTKDISELTNLEELALIISREVYWNTMLVCGDDDDTSESIWMAALSSCLEKLSNLKRLSMESYSVTLCGDALSSFSPSFHKLEDLDLSGWAFSRVPIWIGDLQNLSMLELTSKSTCREDVGIIGMLPSLVQLILRIQGVPKETIEIGATGFSMLKHLLFDCDALSYLTFGVGAMPKLWRLTLGFDEDEWDKATPVGLHNLLSITQIKVFRSKYYDFAVPLSKAEQDKFYGANKDMITGVFLEAADAHPCHPQFILVEGCLRRPRGG